MTMVVVAFFTLSALVLVEGVVIYQLVNKLLRQAKIEPMQILPERESEPIERPRKRLFSMPVN